MHAHRPSSRHLPRKIENLSLPHCLTLPPPTFHYQGVRTRLRVENLRGRPQGRGWEGRRPRGGGEVEVLQRQAGVGGRGGCRGCDKAPRGAGVGRVAHGGVVGAARGCLVLRGGRADGKGYCREGKLLFRQLPLLLFCLSLHIDLFC